MQGRVPVGLLPFDFGIYGSLGLFIVLFVTLSYGSETCGYEATAAGGAPTH